MDGIVFTRLHLNLFITNLHLHLHLNLNLNLNLNFKAIKNEIKMGENELLGSFKSLHVVGHSVNDIVEKQSVQKENFQSIADKVKGL